MISASLAFTVGVFLGTALGVVAMCMFQANKEKDYEE